jgi:choline dehydrogenase-like flavoprotein
MEIDARELPPGSVLEADVCVAGAGPAGLALAHGLFGAGIDVLLLESGGRDADPTIQRLNVGTTEGAPYAGLTETRRRQIGGTARSWNTPVGTGTGAKYVPLDPIDFETRIDDEITGWPLRFDELVPFYHRAQRLCELGPFAYEARDWDEPAPPLLRDDDRLAIRVYQFGTSRWCCIALPAVVTGHARGTLCHHATVTRLVLDRTRQRVEELLAASAPGATLRVRARTSVLALGAIENARLLLASPGVADLSDWVGRCFMEHPRDRALVLVPTDPTAYEALRFFDAHLTPSGVVVGGRLALGTEAAARDGLPNGSVTLLPRLAPRGLTGLLDRWRGRPPATAGYGWSRSPGGSALYEGIQLLTNVEQRPDRDNRVTLGSTRDPLGVPRAHLHWRWLKRDQERLERARQVIASTLERAGLGRVVLDPQALFDPNAHHHAGTTRMAEVPKDGVTDRDGRVFGVENLYVTGSSLFPTAGYANPTLTIVALAIRLADHLSAARGHSTEGGRE